MKTLKKSSEPTGDDLETLHAEKKMFEKRFYIILRV